MHSILFASRVLKAGPGPAQSKGRGVFAIDDIEPDEIIEAAPCLELGPDECARIAGTRIDDYYFHHPGDEDCGLLVFGLASLCNHSEDPNTDTRYAHDHALGWIVVLTARRRIAAGEELTRRYACAPWFATAA